MSEIKIGENRFGEELYAEVSPQHGLWMSIERPDGPCLTICVHERAYLQALAELVAKALAQLPNEEEEDEGD